MKIGNGAPRASPWYLNLPRLALRNRTAISRVKSRKFLLEFLGIRYAEILYDNFSILVGIIRKQVFGGISPKSRRNVGTKADNLILIAVVMAVSLMVYPASGEPPENKSSEFKPVGSKDPFLPLFPKKETEKKNVTVIKPVIKEKEAVKPPELSVQGMVWGKISPQAIINDKVVNVGDMVEDAKIIAITKDGVRVLFEGEIFLIKPLAAAGKKYRLP